MRAVSARVFAGIRISAFTCESAGSQFSVRTANRKRSVAANTISSPSTSIRTPVSIGIESSLPAAIATWLIAVVNKFGSMLPVVAGNCGNSGYSSIVIAGRWKVEEPHFTTTEESSTLTSIGFAGSEPMMSLANLPATSTLPGSWTSALIFTSVDTS